MCCQLKYDSCRITDSHDVFKGIMETGVVQNDKPIPTLASGTFFCGTYTHLGDHSHDNGPYICFLLHYSDSSF